MLGFALRFASPVSGDVQHYGPSLTLGFAANEYAMGAIGTRPTPRLFGDLITFTRAGGGGLTNSLGQFEWVGTNVPRLTYDPVTLQPLGLLVEEQRTNLVLQSAVLATQNVTVTAVAHTLSFYGTGTVTLSGEATGSKVGSGSYPSRSELTFTPTAGTLTLTVTGSVTFGQLEVGPSASSYIPTTTAQVTRAADVATVTTLSPWYNATEGTIVVKYIPSPKGNSNSYVFNLRNLNSDTGMIRVLSPFGPETTISASAGTSGVVTRSGNAAKPIVAAFSWKSGEPASFATNNGQPATVTSLPSTVPDTPVLNIGAYASNTSFTKVNGTIASLEYYPRVIDVQQARA